MHRSLLLLLLTGLLALGANAAWAVTCPGGFTEIVSGGNTLGCMQTAENGTATWENAANTCHTAHGGRLPTNNEWYVAANNYVLTAETDNNE